MPKKTGGVQPEMTIVGGQPGKRYKFPGKIQVPVGVEKILYLAAGDEDFRKKLLEDRQGAIEESKVNLRPSEKGMLSAISNDAISTMLDGIIPENPKRRKFMGLVAAAAASIVAGTVETGCETAGVGPGTDVDVDSDSDTDTDTDTIDTDYPTDYDTQGMDSDTDVDGGPDGSI